MNDSNEKPAISQAEEMIRSLHKEAKSAMAAGNRILALEKLREIKTLKAGSPCPPVSGDSSGLDKGKQQLEGEAPIAAAARSNPTEKKHKRLSSSNPLTALGGIRRRSSLMMGKTTVAAEASNSSKTLPAPPPAAHSRPPALSEPPALYVGESDAAPVSEDASNWERVRSVTYGDGQSEDTEAQVYYKNSTTGETSWDAPQESSEEPAEQVVGKSACWEGMGSSDDDFREEVHGIRSFLSDESTTRVLATQPLRRLCELSQNFGSEDEWISFIENGDFALVQGVARVIEGGFLSGKDEVGDGAEEYYSEAFSFAVRNLILFSKLNRVLWEATGGTVIMRILERAHEALQVSVSHLSERGGKAGINGFSDYSAEEECTVNLMLIQEIFANAPQNGAEDGSHYGNIDIVQRTNDAIFNCLRISDEDLFETAGLCLITINAREDFVIDQKTNQNMFIMNCCSGSGIKARDLIEASLLLLNQNRYVLLLLLLLLLLKASERSGGGGLGLGLLKFFHTCLRCVLIFGLGLGKQ